MKKYETPIVYFIFVLGLFAIMMGIYFFAKSWIFRNQATKASGEIVGIKSRLGGKNKVKEYAAIVSFKVDDEHILKFESQRYSLGMPKVGEKIDVFYTLDPLVAVEDNFASFWGVPIFLLVLGAGFVIFSSIMWRFKSS